MTINQPTIFISMAAIDDEEIKYAIDHAFANAKFPERVFVGVGLTAKYKRFLTSLKKQSAQNPNIRFNYTKQRNNQISTLGIGQGRARAASLYQGEDYMLQIDCHSYLDKDWDVKLIKLFEEASFVVGDSKILLSCIPPLYRYDQDDNVVKIDEPKTRYGTYIVSDFFVSVVPKWQEVDIIQTNKKKFLPAHKLNPAMVFGNKEFAKNPKICPTAIFYDEDWTQQLDLFYDGFAFVFPNIEDFPVRHLDGNMTTKNHERFFFSEYLNNKTNNEIHKKLTSNYISFISKEENKKKIEKYYKYSKAHAEKGYISVSQDFVPRKYRIEE